LVKGHYLIDDRVKYRAEDFDRELLPFGFEQFPNWKAIKEYLLSENQA